MGDIETFEGRVASAQARIHKLVEQHRQARRHLARLMQASERALVAGQEELQRRNEAITALSEENEQLKGLLRSLMGCIEAHLPEAAPESRRLAVVPPAAELVEPSLAGPAPYEPSAGGGSQAPLQPRKEWARVAYG